MKYTKTAEMEIEIETLKEHIARMRHMLTYERSKQKIKD